MNDTDISLIDSGVGTAWIVQFDYFLTRLIHARFGGRCPPYQAEYRRVGIAHQQRLGMNSLE